MRSETELLAEINSELPPIDWHQGARDYVKHFFGKYGRTPVERMAFTKPLTDVTPEDPVGSVREVAAYTYHFANVIELLQLKRGARVLDVACGGGWVSHWLTKIGYQTLGIDISPDFIALARRRMEMDPHLHVSAEEIPGMFAVHNLELDETPDRLRGKFDAAVLESCLHHFVNPITALRHIREMLKDDGVVIVFEGENRQGALPAAYLEIMTETRTLERPYPRSLLTEVFDHAGFPHYEFMGVINGCFPESAWSAQGISQRLAQATLGANNCVCSVSAEALRRVIPSYKRDRSELVDETTGPSEDPAVSGHQRPAIWFRLMWRLRRALGLRLPE